MTPHQRRCETATETLAILKEKAYYHAQSGTNFDLSKEIEKCLEGTITYDATPTWIPKNPGKAGKILVTTESTTAAIQRSLASGLNPRVAALNFASAKTPGGGFESGAQAQEECLARASTLHTSLLSQQTSYYDKNIAEDKPFYSHRAIWSQNVTFFRDEYDQLTEPFNTAIITAASPNQNKIPDELKSETEFHFRMRIELVLAIAANQNVDHLILGAWGCGVFGNSPEKVAAWFHSELAHARTHFESVTFAIFCPQGPDANLLAFQKQFEGN